MPTVRRSPVAEPDQPLADNYFRLTHDDQTGDLQLHPAIAGIGLASALLGELIWDGKVMLRDGNLVCRDFTPPRTALTHRIVEQVVHEPDVRPVADWLNYLALDAHEQVAQRLLDANHVSRVKRRKRLRQHTAYEPSNGNSWVWVRVSITDALNKRRQMPLIDVHLAGLAKVTNLLGAVMAYYDGADFLDYLLPGLPPDVRELLAATAAVVEARVLSGH